VTGKVIPFTSGNDTQDDHAKEFERSMKIFFEKASKSDRIRQDAGSEQLVGVPGGGISKSKRATTDILQKLCSIHTLLASGRLQKNSLKLYQIKTGVIEMHGKHDRYARGKRKSARSNLKQINLLL
jgi:hypothetical protein